MSNPWANWKPQRSTLRRERQVAVGGEREESQESESGLRIQAPSAARTLAWTFLPFVPFFGLIWPLGLLSYRYNTAGSPDTTSDLWLWLVAAIIPLCFLVATFVLPRQADVGATPDHESWVLLRTFRMVGVYALFGLFALLPLLGWIASLYELRECNLTDCDGDLGYRYAMLGLTTATGLIPALWLARFALRRSPMKRLST